MLLPRGDPKYTTALFYRYSTIMFRTLLACFLVSAASPAAPAPAPAPAAQGARSGAPVSNGAKQPANGKAPDDEDWWTE